MRARGDFYLASALPDPEGHLQVLATPDVHSFVVGADLVEVGTGDGEQTAGHRWGVERLGGVLEKRLRS